MRIGFMGAGNAATAFGLYLLDQHASISGYYSLHLSSTQKAASLTNSKCFSELSQLIEQSDCIGVLTGDDQLETAAAQLSQQITAPLEQTAPKLFFHMSGSKTSEVLYPLKALGHHVISLHPLQTLNEPLLGRELLKTCYYALEGDEVSAVSELMAYVKGPVIRLSKDQKPLYHSAACMASNYLYTLAEKATEAMVLAGFTPEDGLKALLPLMQGSLKSLESQMPDTALTGPIARGDVDTVSLHVSALNEQAALKRFYQQMGLATLQLASSKKLQSERERSAIEQLLQEEERAYEHNKNNR